LAPVLFRVPALFGVFVVTSGVRFLVLRSISSAVCALRTRWPQRALRPLL